MKWLAEDELTDAVVLFLANKQDLPRALTVAEIVEKLKLHQLMQGRRWAIHPTCAVNGEGAPYLTPSLLRC